MKRVARGVAMMVAVLLAAGCAHYEPGTPQDNVPVYSPSRQGGDMQVQYGVVSAIDTVAGVKGSASGAGAALGAIAGMAIGREFGFSGDGKATGMVLGTLGGAIIGHEIEKDQNGRRAVVRVSVQLDQGGMRQFDFGSVGDLKVGERVRIEANKLYRM